MCIVMRGEIEKNYISAHNPNYFVTTPVAVAWDVALLTFKRRKAACFI
jgi:hypothetical protein